MKENIETKDVQRTEYLDKSGLDMLWAKVKENTQNQVEVERNRATTQENRIIDTKADKSELHSSYVSNSTFTALQEKVAANTDAISDKQDVGNYLSYKTLNNEGYYEIPDIRIPDSGGNNKTDIDSQSISVNCDYPASRTTITCDGISNTDNNANHVYATDGSIADLTQYAKKTDISEVDTSNFVSKTTTDRQIIRSSLSIKDTLYVDSDIYVSGDRDSYIKMYNSTNSSTYSALNYNFVSVRDRIAEMRNSSTSITSYKLDSSQPTGLGDAIFSLDERGVRLLDGDDNHVLTSNASTIDITQYVLKSVYDEKIAALEARIAALEAKHAETA